MPVPRATWAFVFGAIACGGGGAGAPTAAIYVVDVPPVGDEPQLATPGSASTVAAACPPDTVPEKSVCVRVLASPEIPTWQPPQGHGDPCATWTSEKGLFDCDAKNEDTPAAGDAGASSHAPHVRR